MMTRRLLLSAAALLLATVCWAAEAPVTDRAVVTIHPGDRPMERTAVRELLTDNADRLGGQSGWRPPEDLGPSGITKEDYLEALRPHLASCEQQYGKEPATPKQYAYEAIPTFVAFYLGTGDPRYAELALRTYREYCQYVEQELETAAEEAAKDPRGRPGISRYWAYNYAYLVTPLLALEGTPLFPEIAECLGEVLARRANAWPLYWERGPHNRPIFAAFWYEFALKHGSPGPRTAELREYTDLIWNDWWPHRDVEEDCSGYTSLDLLVLDAWARVRGVNWWEDPEGQNLWRHYADQMGNDGTWTWYGDGGAPGDYVAGMRNAELAATRTRDGRYKWFARRSFWNVRDRLPDLCAGIGYRNYMELAMAYIYADDTIQEVPPEAGLTITHRRFRERHNWNVRQEMSVLFKLHEYWAPSKLIFRSGGRESNQYLVLQAASQAGHGHPDIGDVLVYGGDLGYYLCHGVTRLDHDMEHRNVLVLRDPESTEPWKPVFTSEGHDVPVSGQTGEAAYARLHVAEFPGNTPDEQAWEAVRAWKGGGYPPEKAIGYKNWPVRWDRSVLFVYNQFTAVRDVINPVLPFRAQIGPNWRFAQMGPTLGENWVNVWTPKLYGHYYSQPPKAPVEIAQRDLLIWFAPHAEGAMQIVDGPDTSWYGNYFIQHPRRVWYQRTAGWQPDQPQAFTTLLLPHAPVADPERLAGGIKLVKDEPGLTVISVNQVVLPSGETAGAAAPDERLVLFNSSGQRATYGSLITDAEAALLTVKHGRTVHLSVWGATLVSLRGQVLHRSTEPESMELEAP